jgi:hypothetical protein
MADPQEKLAESLEALHRLQARGAAAIRSRDLSRTHRERLVKAGFLKEVIKGWYIPARPDEAPGDSTAWYASFTVEHQRGIGHNCRAPFETQARAKRLDVVRIDSGVLGLVSERLSALA